MHPSFTLFCASNDQADVPMGEDYPSVEAARAATPAMMAEWDAQCGDGDKLAAECKWYVWDNRARCVVE